MSDKLYTMKRNATREFDAIQKVQGLVAWIDKAVPKAGGMKYIAKSKEEPMKAFLTFIMDGELLCKTVMKLKPDYIKKVHENARVEGRNYTFKMMQNVQYFIHAGLKMGVKQLPFSPTDLFEGANSFAVLEFIWNVKQLTELAPGAKLRGSTIVGADGKPQSPKTGDKAAPPATPTSDDGGKKKRNSMADVAEEVIDHLREAKKDEELGIEPVSPVVKEAKSKGLLGTLKGLVTGKKSAAEQKAAAKKKQDEADDLLESFSPASKQKLAATGEVLIDDPDLLLEARAELALKKEHVALEKILPVIYVDGDAVEQEVGTTLAEIRAEYKNKCKLKERDAPNATFEKNEFVLTNGKGYDMIKGDDMTEEELKVAKETAKKAAAAAIEAEKAKVAAAKKAEEEAKKGEEEAEKKKQKKEAGDAKEDDKPVEEPVSPTAAKPVVVGAAKMGGKGDKMDALKSRLKKDEKDDAKLTKEEQAKLESTVPDKLLRKLKLRGRTAQAAVRKAGLGPRGKKLSYAYSFQKQKRALHRRRRRTRVTTTFEANEIIDRLWLGDRGDSMNKDALKERGITHIYTAACDIPPAHPDDFTYKVLELLDSSTQNIRKHFAESFEFINKGRAEGNAILVHCQQGVSRSAAIVMSYLMGVEKKNFDDAGDHVCEKRMRVCPNFGFMKQLKEYGDHLEAGGDPLAVEDKKPDAAAEDAAKKD